MTKIVTLRTIDDVFPDIKNLILEDQDFLLVAILDRILNLDGYTPMTYLESTCIQQQKERLRKFYKLVDEIYDLKHPSDD